MVREKTKQPLPAVPETSAVLEQLDRILSTPLFQHSKRYPAFLRYIVEQTLQGCGDELKERTLGIAVFKRSLEYDTSADPVVRNTASEVRKRLDEYYSEADRQGELRIVLSAGGYVPEFRPAASAVPAAGEPIAHAPRLQTRLSKRSVVAIGLIAALGILAAYELLPGKPAVERFWAPILQASDPVLVVTDTLMARRQAQADSAANSGVQEVFDPKAFLYVSQQSAKLALFLGAHGKRADYELARNIGIAKLRERPFILKGAFNNQWTLRAVAPLRFCLKLELDSHTRRILDRNNPAQQDWQAPMTPTLAADYALIARAPEPETGQMMLVIAGLGEQGSAAALEFVTNPKYLARFAAQAQAGWDRRNIELVIKTDLVNGDWGEPRVVATNLW
ncbi:MAG: hypothetical protein KGN36_16570 [Acidobacteriota bacterium]|nr:hypothetical protein [Acidobacteriota bacterium]